MSFVLPGLMKGIHTAYMSLLALVFILTVVSIGMRGCTYYMAPEEERPYLPLYDRLKPSGIEGHGYGVLGTFCIAAGVVIYSGRKRIRRFMYMGKISYFLEFHIFLCLAGPMLVLYHTTFKFGGLVAVSFWSMAAVVVSGVVGRYLYTQIPRGIQGNELSAADLERERGSLENTLREKYGVASGLLATIDALALPPGPIDRMSWSDVLRFFIMQDLTRRRALHRTIRAAERRLSHKAAHALRRLAARRLVLARRIAFLQRFRQMFQYWHVIHLPFSIIMFVILLVHVAVAVIFGYTWIF